MPIAGIGSPAFYVLVPAPTVQQCLIGRSESTYHMDTNLTLGLVGLLIGVVGIVLTVRSSRLLTKGLKISFLQHLRTLINRMEEEKHKCPTDSSAWSAMHHTQQDLDAQFKSLQKMFSISDKDAPLT
jgi:hypothetical protein